MLESRVGRLVGVAFLLIVLVGVCVGFGIQTAVTAGGPLPGQDQLAYDYDAYVGDEAEVSGIVINTEPVVLAAEYQYFAEGQRYRGVLTITIRGVSEPVAEGDIMQVAGTVEEGQALTARNAVAVPNRNVWYMYTVSALAGFWVLGRLLAGWRFDPRQSAVVRRENAISFEEWLRPGPASEEAT